MSLVVNAKAAADVCYNRNGGRISWKDTAAWLRVSKSDATFVISKVGTAEYFLICCSHRSQPFCSFFWNDVWMYAERVQHTT